MKMTMMKRPAVLFLLVLLLASFVLPGCGSSKNAGGGNAPSATQGGNTPAATGSEAQAAKTEVKNKPDTMTKVKIALPTTALQYWPWYVADKEGIFKKYNLDVEIQRVDSGVVALRGLQAGDFKFITSNAESVITGISEGAKAKFIGALTSQSIEAVYVSPDIKSANDLKGKAAASFQPGSGVDFQLRYWLDKNGLKPDTDIRVLSSGATKERFTAVKSGAAQVTIVVPPYNYEAEAAGLKQLGDVKDILKTYNHDMIIANTNVLSKEPEVARALMAATAEAIAFVKNPANKARLIEIGKQSSGSSEEIVTKSLDYLLPAFPDKAKPVEEGISLTIKSLKEMGVLKKDVAVQDLYDDSFYPRN